MAKSRNKNSAGEKSPAAPQEDAGKKAQKSGGANGASAPGSQGPRPGSCLGSLATTVFYLGLIGAAGFAAFYLQQVVEEIRQTSGRHEESARLGAELSTKMENVAQQVESLRSVVDGLESSLGITRVELEGAVSRMKKGEVETRRVEEALQKLQNDLLRDLSEGINEVKEARERDFSSLEKTVEERLAEVSQSITASVAEFTEAQGEAQSQLADLKARLGDMEDPALIKEELTAIVSAVAEIKTAKNDADSSANSLRDQISSVRNELQTRNHEVASLSKEVETMRSAVQEAVGSLKQTLSATEAGVQALKDRTETLEGGMQQAADAARSAEQRAHEAAAQAQKRSDDLEARVKEGGDALSEVSAKVESLLAKYDAHESALATQREAVEGAKAGVDELEALKGRVEEMQSAVDALGGAHSELVLKDPGLGQRVEELERRMDAVEESSAEPERRESSGGAAEDEQQS
ncbi:cytoskeleton-associated protein 4 [Betta splendens]|uniref:Cytoskeleton-associated protein 4 n=1 Tax=Betta splendens TaxID=158456 RepID=A0A6P7NJ77_BETSP|nr:cytoskeleton-associated protein 4 [Betta splendens]